MSMSPVTFPRLSALTLALFIGTSCGDHGVATAPTPSASKANAGGGKTSDPTVTAADPAFGLRATTLEVRVLGTNFDNGSTAEWALKGVVNPNRVRTNSTRYVSSKELVANITIAEDADLALYDIMVTTTKGKKGVAIEMFEVVPEVNVSATFTLSSSSAVSSVYGDGLNADGGANGSTSVYVDGRCGVQGLIYASSSVGGTGDGFLLTNKPQLKVRDCVGYPRKSGANYADGSDYGAVVMNAKDIRDITGTALRQFTVRIEGSRCYRLWFSAAKGSSWATVTRLDEFTWRVASTPVNAAGQTTAFCEKDGSIRLVQPFSLEISILPQ